MMDMQFLDLSLLWEGVEDVISYCVVERFSERRAVGWWRVPEHDHILGSCDVFAGEGWVYGPSRTRLDPCPSRTVAVMELMEGERERIRLEVEVDDFSQPSSCWGWWSTAFSHWGQGRGVCQVDDLGGRWIPRGSAGRHRWKDWLVFWYWVSGLSGCDRDKGGGIYVLNLVLRPFSEIKRAEMYDRSREATKAMGWEEI